MVKSVPNLGDLEQFLYHEAKLLDSRRFEDWSDLFTDDGDYWMPVSADQPDPLNHVSILYEDRTLMALRNERFNHPNIFSQQPPSSTVHLISNVQLEQVDAESGILDVRSTFMVVETRGTGQTVFAGSNEHALVPEGDSFRIKRKKVLLVNASEPHANIYVYL